MQVLHMEAHKLSGVGVGDKHQLAVEPQGYGRSGHLPGVADPWTTLLTLALVSQQGRGKQTHRQDAVLRTSVLYWFGYRAARKASR